MSTALFLAHFGVNRKQLPEGGSDSWDVILVVQREKQLPVVVDQEAGEQAAEQEADEAEEGGDEGDLGGPDGGGGGDQGLALAHLGLPSS